MAPNWVGVIQVVWQTHTHTLINLFVHLFWLKKPKWGSLPFLELASSLSVAQCPDGLMGCRGNGEPPLRLLEYQAGPRDQQLAAAAAAAVLVAWPLSRRSLSYIASPIDWDELSGMLCCCCCSFCAARLRSTRFMEDTCKIWKKKCFLSYW